MPAMDWLILQMIKSVAVVLTCSCSIIFINVKPFSLDIVIDVIFAADNVYFSLLSVKSEHLKT